MKKDRKLGTILQLVISLVLLFLLFWLIGWEAVVEQLAALNWGWYSLAFGLFLLSVALRAYRWYVLLRVLNKRPSFPHLLYLYLVGFFANNFIPSGFGGDVVKVVSLRQSYGHGTEALSSVLMDRIIGLLGSSLIALIALGWNSFFSHTPLTLTPAIFLTIILISLGIPLAFGLMRWAKPVSLLAHKFPATRKLPKFDKLEELADTVRRYPLSSLLQSLAISLPFTLCLVLAHYSIARALAVVLPFSVFGLFVPLIAIIGLLPISFNGLGVREGLYQFLYVPIGVAEPTALAMSLALYFLRFGTGLVGGLLYAGVSLRGLWRPVAE
jgi:uncharacterized protein (TIRG00374 family)